MKNKTKRTWLAKWGFISLIMQLSMLAIVIAVPQVAAAFAGGAALGVAAQLLGVNHFLVGLLKSAAPGAGGLIA